MIFSQFYEGFNKEQFASSSNHPKIIFLNNHNQNSFFHLLTARGTLTSSDCPFQYQNQNQNQNQFRKDSSSSDPINNLQKIPFHLDHIRHKDSDFYTIYNIQQKFSFLIENVLQETDRIPTEDLSSDDVGSRSPAQKLLVVIEFDLADVRESLTSILKLKQELANYDCHYGVVLITDKLLKYDGEDEKLDFIQQVVRSISLNLPKSFVASISPTRPDTSANLAKYVLYLLKDLEQKGDSSFEIMDDLKNEDLFVPSILSLETLFIPSGYDSPLKILAINERFHIGQFTELSLEADGFWGCEREIETTLYGDSIYRGRQKETPITAKDEQELLYSIKVVVDKLAENRQAMQMMRTSTTTAKEVPAPTKTSASGHFPRSATISSSSHTPRAVGGLVAHASSASTVPTLLSKDPLPSSRSTSTRSATSNSKSSTPSLPHDQEDMSAKIAKLLEQSKSVKDKFNGLSSSTASKSDGIASNNEVLSAYFQSLLKK